MKFCICVLIFLVYPLSQCMLFCYLLPIFLKRKCALKYKCVCFRARENRVPIKHCSLKIVFKFFELWGNLRLSRSCKGKTKRSPVPFPWLFPVITSYRIIVCNSNAGSWDWDNSINTTTDLIWIPLVFTCTSSTAVYYFVPMGSLLNLSRI